MAFGGGSGVGVDAFASACLPACLPARLLVFVELIIIGRMESYYYLTLYVLSFATGSLQKHKVIHRRCLVNFGFAISGLAQFIVYSPRGHYFPSQLHLQFQRKSTLQSSQYQNPWQSHSSNRVRDCSSTSSTQLTPPNHITQPPTHRSDQNPQQKVQHSTKQCQLPRTNQIPSPPSPLLHKTPKPLHLHRSIPRPLRLMSRWIEWSHRR